MTQRVALACALVGSPRTIVLDEPTTGLDPQGVEGLLRLVGDLRREGRTVVICSHDLAQLELVCDRVTCLRMGRVTADGWVNEVARNVPSPAHIVRTSDDVVAAKLLSTVGIDCTIATRGLQVSSTQDVGAALGVLAGHVSVTEVTVNESLFARIYSMHAAAPGSRGSGETRR